MKAKTHSFYPCNQLTLIDHVIFGNGFPCGMQPISTFSPSITLNCVGVMRLTVGASNISRKKRDDLRYKVNEDKCSVSCRYNKYQYTRYTKPLDTLLLIHLNINILSNYRVQ